MNSAQNRKSRQRLNPSTKERVLSEANHSFTLSRDHHKEGLLNLARHGLLAESVEDIEGMFHVFRPTPAEAEVIYELTSLLGGSSADQHRLAHDEIMKSSWRAERSGDTYPDVARLAFPPQICAKYSVGTVTIPIRDLLHWLAENARDRNPKASRDFFAIADEFYPEEEVYGGWAVMM